ncbi:MAG: ParA family protein [Anaerolineaceae bacterium]|nr:ParA family protein [Anaerolineaceae bacterium]
MIAITVTNMKGGVGKTTLSMLLAKYIAADNPDLPVIVIDMDHQIGSTVLLNGTKQPTTPTITNILQAIFDGEDCTGLISEAFINVESVCPNLYLIPADIALAQFATNGSSIELLKQAIDSIKEVIFQNYSDACIIIDTGPLEHFVTMGMEAADVVLVPVTLSDQTLIPSARTIMMSFKLNKKYIGIVPSAVGTAKWESLSIESFSEKLQAHPIAEKSTCKLFQGIPHSRLLIRGDWLHNEKSILPEKFQELVNSMYSEISSHADMVGG